jgi:signal transduction histidine kinase
MLDTRTLDLECIVNDTLDELNGQIPPAVDLVMETQPGPFLVRADPERIAQALENLALNARDAVLAQGSSDNGELRVSLRRLSVEDEEKTPCPELGPGEWICLRVSDTGTGMSEEICKHLFEPFFTTKEIGEGRGLGLPQVYGIVRQHHGVIDFDTEPGQGTTFHIYLPAHQGEDGPPGHSPGGRGGGRVGSGEGRWQAHGR